MTMRLGKLGSNRSLMGSSSRRRKESNKLIRTSSGDEPETTTTMEDSKNVKSTSSRPRRQSSNRSLIGNSSVGSSSQVIASLWDSHSGLALSKQPSTTTNSRRRRQLQRRSSVGKMDNSNNSIGASAQSAPAMLSAGRRRERYEREYDKVYLPNNTSRGETSAGGARSSMRSSQRRRSIATSTEDASVCSMPVAGATGLATKVRNIESTNERRMKEPSNHSRIWDNPDGVYLRVEENGRPVGPVVEEGLEEGSLQDFVIEVANDLNNDVPDLTPFEEQNHNSMAVVYDEGFMLDMIIEVPRETQERQQRPPREARSPPPPQSIPEDLPFLDVVIEVPQDHEPWEDDTVQEEIPAAGPHLGVVLEDEEEEIHLGTYHNMRNEALKLEQRREAVEAMPEEEESVNLDTYHQMREQALQLKAFQEDETEQFRNSSTRRSSEPPAATTSRLSSRNEEVNRKPTKPGNSVRPKRVSKRATKGVEDDATRFTAEEVHKLQLDSEKVAQAQVDAAEEVRRLKAAKLAKKSKAKRAASVNGGHQNVRDLASKLSQVKSVRRHTACEF